MKNTTQLTLTVANDVPELLAELIGDEAEVGHFLTKLAHTLYEQQQKMVSAELMIAKLETLATFEKLAAIERKLTTIENRLNTDGARVRSFVAEIDQYLETLAAKYRKRTN